MRSRESVTSANKSEDEDPAGLAHNYVARLPSAGAPSCDRRRAEARGYLRERPIFMGLLGWQAHEGGPFPTVAAGFSLTATPKGSGGSVTKLCAGPGTATQDAESWQNCPNDFTCGSGYACLATDQSWDAVAASGGCARPRVLIIPIAPLECSV